MLTLRETDNRTKVQLHSGIYWLNHETVHKIVTDPAHSYGRIILDLNEQGAGEMYSEPLARVVCFAIIEAITAQYN